MESQPTIFIQIASYRDPQLIETIKDCLAKADSPESLSFGITNQDDFDPKNSNIGHLHSLNYFLDEEYKPHKLIYNWNEQITKEDYCKELEAQDLEKYPLRMVTVPFELSKGACWARWVLQQLYAGEDYTLQLDSHMRFEQGWDTMLIEWMDQLKSMGHEKPLITCYATSFDPDNDPDGRAKAPWRMTFDRFTPEGCVFFLPEDIPNWEDILAPVPARFYSAHMAFADGHFTKIVQHDPNMYFHGEEISISVRAYTHGYDLFHPHRLCIYHEYTRKGRTKQWNDDKDWTTKNDAAHSINRKLLGVDGEGGLTPEYKYGLGNERELSEYEAYAGIRFKDRSIQQYTVDKFYPPNPKYPSVELYNDSFNRVFKHCIDLHKNSVPLDDYSFIAVIFEDENGNQLNRHDIQEAQANNLKNTANDQDFINLWREFHTDKQPKKWVVWPHSKSQGWVNKIEHNL